MDFGELLSKIMEKTGSSQDDIQRKIIEKQRELSNLVSKEGAAYIIAKELGLDVFPKTTKKRLEIKNIVPKIRDLKLSARIVRVFEPREFKGKTGKQGKVASIILGDESGNIRLSLWDDQTDVVEKLSPGMAVETFGAYTKEDGVGGVELRLGKLGGVKILENSDLPEIKSGAAPSGGGRTSIADLKEGETCELRASVVQLFETGIFYEICPTCGSRVTKEGKEFKCAEHGTVEPTKTIVLSGIIDDGTGNIRVVFFRDVALALIGMDIKKAVENEDAFFESINVLGKEFIVTGKARKNKMFNRLEFIATRVSEVNPIEEAAKILNNLQSKVKV